MLAEEGGSYTEPGTWYKKLVECTELRIEYCETQIDCTARRIGCCETQIECTIRRIECSENQIECTAPKLSATKRQFTSHDAHDWAIDLNLQHRRSYPHKKQKSCSGFLLK